MANKARPSRDEQRRLIDELTERADRRAAPVLAAAEAYWDEIEDRLGAEGTDDKTEDEQ